MSSAATRRLRVPRSTWIRGIRSRMLIFFGLVFVMSVAGLQWTQLYGLPIGGFEGQAAELRREALADLSLVADLKKERLLRWLEERRDDVRVLADSPLVGASARELESFIREQESRGMADAALQNAVRQHPAFLDLTQHLELARTSYGVYDALDILDGAGRTVIASTRASDVGVLHAATAIDFTTIAPGTIEMRLDVPTEGGAALLLIARTITGIDGAPSGVEHAAGILLAEVDLEDLVRPMLNTGAGLGQTGEVLLVDEDARILTSLAHPLKDGSTAVPLDYRITAQSAVLATRGEEGIVEARDYRGVSVLAAYRHIPITAGIGWGLVVKQDEGEVLASVNDRVAEALVVGVVGIGVALVVVWVVAATISRPVRALAATARRVEDGDLGARTRVNSSGEVGELAETFNSMVERVEERTAELAAANRDLEAFAYSVSHDLRAPLRATDGFSQLLLEEHAAGLSEDGKRYLGYVREGAQRMGDLIDDLLTFSRLGHQPLSIVSVDPAGVARQALAELGPEQEGRQVEVTVADLPECQADPALLRQVYTNLLSNALKFSRDRDVARIEVGSATDGGEVVYFVRDNGIGFEMEYAERIFTVFQRLERREDYEGTGIGLAIVQRVVQRHGGRAWAEGRPGRGAILYFTLLEASDGGRHPDRDPAG